MTFSDVLTTTQFRSSYDHNAKLLISKKECLARILKGCVSEFRDMSISEIIPCIDSVRIEKVPLSPGMTNHDPLRSLDKEDYVPDEGTVVFDLLFDVILEKQERIRIQINIEIHNQTESWKELIPRSVYYPVRMLSAQGDRDISLAKQEYDRLHKVISIWISLNVPQYMADTIVSYSLKPEFAYGTPYEIKGNYDLLETIHVNIGKEPEKSNQLLGFLFTLLSNRYSAVQKEKILTSEYEIDLNEDDRRRMENMEGFVDGFIRESREEGFRTGKEEGIKEGMKQGKDEGVKQMRLKNAANAAKAVSSGKLSMADAVELFEVTEQEITEYQKSH